jgi:hypothetical protein
MRIIKVHLLWKGVRFLKTAIAILFSFFLAVHFLPEKTTAQQPAWNMEVKQGPESAEIQFTVYNNTSAKMTLEFPSSQFFDYEVVDQAGNKVYRYSDNKAFLQAIQKITLTSGQTKVWRDNWDYKSSNGKRVSAGSYTIKGTLMVKEMNGKPIEGKLVQEEKMTVESENPSFRNVGVSSLDGAYSVTGEAKVTAGSFYYTVEDGHNILKEETLVKVNKEYPNWTSFTFTFDLASDNLPKDRPVLLNLYERDLKEGTIYHTYTVRLN